MEYSCPETLRHDRLICLDLETTGLSPTFNNIIELGVVEVKEGKVVTRYSRLFGGGRSSMYLVQNVHHIRDAERTGQPTFAECAQKIADYLAGAILITHNGAHFDIPFMQTKMASSGVRFDIHRHIDTIVVSRRLKHEHNSLKWLCGKYGIPYGDDNHRGLTDCLCTLQLFYALCDRYGTEEVLK